MTALDALVGVVLTLATLSLLFRHAASAAEVSCLVQALTTALGDGPGIDLFSFWLDFRDATLVAHTTLHALVSVGLRTLATAILAAGAVKAALIEVALAASWRLGVEILGQGSKELWILGISESIQFNAHAGSFLISQRNEADESSRHRLAIVSVEAMAFPCVFIMVTHESSGLLCLSIHKKCPFLAILGNSNIVFCYPTIVCWMTKRAKAMNWDFMSQVNLDPLLGVLGLVSSWDPCILGQGSCSRWWIFGLTA